MNESVTVPETQQAMFFCPREKENLSRSIRLNYSALKVPKLLVGVLPKLVARSLVN